MAAPSKSQLACVILFSDKYFTPLHAPRPARYIGKPLCFGFGLSLSAAPAIHAPLESADAHWLRLIRDE